MQVVGAHKSMFIFDTIVRGHEAHSSQQHRGVPAIMVAGRLIGWLAERQRRNALEAEPDCDFVPGYTTLHCGTVCPTQWLGSGADVSSPVERWGSCALPPYA